MRLFLVQHGEAVSKDIASEQPLTEKGKKDSEKTARFLKTSGMSIDVILHSEKRRAIETAYIFKDILLPKDGIQQKDGLSPNDAADNIFAVLASMKKDIMIVGHLPFLQKLISLLLLNSESYKIVKFNMGGVVVLEQSEEGKWQLIFKIVPDLLRET